MSIAAVSKRGLQAVGLRDPLVRGLRRYRAVRHWFRVPPHPGLRITAKRRLNYYLSKWQQQRGDTKLRAYPIAMTIEATNACNLRCPYCFTGAGEIGREKSMLQMPLYRKVLDELGDRLMVVEFYNWGEPLLNKDVHEMIAAASGRGISTIISSNLSVPLTAERAEQLVASGLAQLGVSLDGAAQESYEQYRVRGNFDLIMKNVRLLNDAKKKLRSSTPELIWEYHIFKHNKHEIEQARAMAAELDMTFCASKGWVAGPDWDPEGEFQFFGGDGSPRCAFLWQRAVIHNDGGVAPCCATFYKEDDFATLGGEPSVALSEMAGSRFRELWNNEMFQQARSLFQRRDGDERVRGLVCFECPITVMWDDFKKHTAQGFPRETFKPPNGNDGFNFFFQHKPERPAKLPASAPAGDLIALEAVSSSASSKDGA